MKHGIPLTWLRLCPDQWPIIVETGLSLTASTESAIHLKTTTSPNFSSPETRKYLSEFLSPLLKEVSKYTLPLPKLPTPSGRGQRADVTPEDIYQAQVTTAWIYFLIGERETVLETLPPEEDIPKLTGSEGVGYEYTRVAVIKAIVLKGKGGKKGGKKKRKTNRAI